jgi:hypothetical protein
MHGPEHQVKKRVTQYFKDHNIYYFMPVQTGYGTTSLDYLCCWQGLFVGIECKAGSNDLTNRQRMTMHAILSAGGKCLVIRDTDNVEGRLDGVFAARPQA